MPEGKGGRKGRIQQRGRGYCNTHILGGDPELWNFKAGDFCFGAAIPGQKIGQTAICEYNGIIQVWHKIQII